MAEVTAPLATFISALTLNLVPDGIKHETRRFVLDTFGLRDRRCTKRPRAKSIRQQSFSARARTCPLPVAESSLPRWPPAMEMVDSQAT